MRYTNRSIPVAGTIAIAVVTAATVLVVPAQAANQRLKELVDRIPDRDPDGKHTAPALKDLIPSYNEILRGGSGSVSDLIDLLVEPGKSEDYKARYLTHALAIYVSGPGREKDRRVFVDALVASLPRATSRNVKIFIIGELQFLGARRAAPAIARTLSDEHICDASARALVTIGSENAHLLASALGDARGTGKLTIIQALGDMRDAQSAPSLSTLLTDTSSDVRASAAAALSKIASAESVDAMLAALEKSSGYERMLLSDACFVLASNLSQSGDKDRALAICRSIWDFLEDREEQHLRFAVADSIAAGFRNEATRKLVNRLRADDAATRAAVLLVLEDRADPSAFDEVAYMMSDKDPWVRLLAAKALGPVGGSRSVPMLVAALPGDGPQARQILRNALLSLSGEGCNQTIADRLALIPDDAESTAKLIDVMQVLAVRNAGEGAEAVSMLVSSENADVRMTAIKSLGKIASGEFTPKLVALLMGETRKDELRALEDAVLDAGRRIKGRAQIEAIRPLLDSAGPGHRAAGMRLAGKFANNHAVAVLTSGLEDSDSTVSDAAMRSLAECPNRDVVGKLLEIAGTTGNLKHHVLAIRGYLTLAGQERDERKRLPVVIKAMDRARRIEEKKLVLGAISRIRTVDALNQATRFLSDDKLRQEAALAAISVGRNIYRHHGKEVIAAMELVLERCSDKSNIINSAKDTMRKAGKK